jgi:hypothetical protein
LLFSDAAGNDERLAFIYDSEKVALMEEVGEVTIPPTDIRYIRLPGIEQRFEGFDRNPYLAGFTLTCGRGPRVEGAPDFRPSASLRGKARIPRRLPENRP